MTDPIIPETVSDVNTVNVQALVDQLREKAANPDHHLDIAYFVGLVTEFTLHLDRKDAWHYRDTSNRVDWHERANGAIEILLRLNKCLTLLPPAALTPPEPPEPPAPNEYERLENVVLHGFDHAPRICYTRLTETLQWAALRLIGRGVIVRDGDYITLTPAGRAALDGGK